MINNPKIGREVVTVYDLKNRFDYIAIGGGKIPAGTKGEVIDYDDRTKMVKADFGPNYGIREFHKNSSNYTEG